MSIRSTIVRSGIIALGALVGFLTGSGRLSFSGVAQGQDKQLPAVSNSPERTPDRNVAAPAVALAHNAAVAANLQGSGKKPNIVIIWGDDIGQSDISAYSMGLMGFKTPNIDRVAKEGVIFTD